jgi:hypothetical protein
MEQQFNNSNNQQPITQLGNPALPARFNFFYDATYPAQVFRGAQYTINQLPYGNLGLTGFSFDDVSIYQYQMNTYPSSGVTTPNHIPQFLAPSLSATTCIGLTGLTYNPYSADSSNFRTSYWRNLYTYVIGLTDANNDVYSIYTLPRQTNGTVSQTLTLIGTGTGSTVTVLNPTYFTP